MAESSGRPAWSRALRAVLLRDSLFFLACRVASKFGVFAFVVLVAKRVSQEDFGDFQFVVAVINVLTQPAIILTMIVAWIGCEFPAETREQNLRWFFRSGRALAIVALCLLVLLGALADVPLAAQFHIAARWSFVYAAAIVGVTLILNYYLGILQALEAFYRMGAVFLLTGVLTAAAAVPLVWREWGVTYAYAAQLGALIVTLVGALGLIHQRLPREAHPSNAHRAHGRQFSVMLVCAVSGFFVLYNMDVLASKLVFDRVEAGYYARLELIGKMAFVLSSSLGVILFPRVVKARNSGENPVPYLVRGTVSFLAFACAAFVGAIAVAPHLLRALFGPEFEGAFTVLMLILCAKLSQSFLFLLLNYVGALIDAWVLGWVVALIGVQATLFALNHDAPLNIAADIAVVGVLGAALLLARVVRRERALAYATTG